MRFPIRFDRAFAILCYGLLLPPRNCYIELEGDEISVRFAWSFRARFPRSSVVSVRPVDAHPLSRGVHGMFGKWLVNGSGDGIVAVTLEPAARAWLLGFSVRLRELQISVDDPTAFVAALDGRRSV